jgi:hypothetical protein
MATVGGKAKIAFRHLPEELEQFEGMLIGLTSRERRGILRLAAGREQQNEDGSDLHDCFLRLNGCKNCCQ